MIFNKANSVKVLVPIFIHLAIYLLGIWLIKNFNDSDTIYSRVDLVSFSKISLVALFIYIYLNIFYGAKMFNRLITVVTCLLIFENTFALFARSEAVVDDFFDLVSTFTAIFFPFAIFIGGKVLRLFEGHFNNKLVIYAFSNLLIISNLLYLLALCSIHSFGKTNNKPAL